MNEIAAVLRSLYCERGTPSGAKLMATAATVTVLYYVWTAGDSPDFSGAALFLGVPWGIILGRKHVEPVKP